MTHRGFSGIVLGLWSLTVGAGCKADLPALTDAKASLDGRCGGPHADLLVDFFPASLTKPSAVLGDADGMSVSLAATNRITVGFVGLGGLTDASGPDLRIHATVAAGASATVELAASDSQFRFAGTLSSTVNQFDVAVAENTSAVYARVIDVSGTIAIDAFEAIHDKCH